MNNQEKAGFAFFALTAVVILVWLFVFPGDSEKGKTSPRTDSFSQVAPIPVPEKSLSDSDTPVHSQPDEIPQPARSAQNHTAVAPEKKSQLILKLGAPPLRIPVKISAQQKNLKSGIAPAGGRNSGANERKKAVSATGDLQSIAYDELRETLAAALQIENPEEKRIRLEELGLLLSQDDSSLALEVLGQMENQEDRKTFVSSFLAALYMETPEEALYWVSQINDENLSLFSHNLIAKEWVQQDIHAAYEWALQLENSSNRLEVLEVIGKTLAKEDPQSTVEWAMQFDDEITRTQLVANTISTWAVKDMIGLANWAIQLPETEENNVIISRQFSLWTQFSPENASQWAVKIDDHDLMTKAVTTVATFWSKSSHEKAAEWLLANDQAESDQQIATLTSIVKDWSKKDPHAAGNWLADVTDPEVKKMISEVIGSE